MNPHQVSNFVTKANVALEKIFAVNVKIGEKSCKAQLSARGRSDQLEMGGYAVSAIVRARVLKKDHAAEPEVGEILRDTTKNKRWRITSVTDDEFGKAWVLSLEGVNK